MSRILHIPRRFATDEWGGTESVVFNLCREQIELGWGAEIHTSRALCPVASETWRGIPIRRYRYQYPFFGLSAADIHALDKKGGNLLSIDLFMHMVAARDVRVYHAHVLNRMGGCVLTAAKIRKKPYVVTIHGNVFDVPAEEATSVAAAQQGRIEWGKPFGVLFGSRKILTDADAVLCVGYSEYEKARSVLGHDRVYHLPNGVNPAQFQRGDRAAALARLGWPDDAIAFGCLSRIDPQKNQLLLVKAFAALVAERPEMTFRLLLGGPVTSAAYRDQIVDLIRERGIESLVTLHPAVEAESALHRDLLAALDVFVLPSRHEPFGIVVLEAWAARLPVIASDAGGLRQLVSDGSDGLSFPSGDEQALVRAMAVAAGDPGLRRGLADQGNLKMMRHHTWGVVAAKLEEIYQTAEERFR